MLINFDDANKSDSLDSENAIAPELQSRADITNMIATNITRQTKAKDDSNILDKLYTLCIGSKLTRVVRQNRSMTAISKKLETVYVNL